MSARDARAHLPDGSTRILGIVGDPLAHSLSPALHTAVLRRLDRNLIYVPFPVSARRLPSFLRLAGELGVVGINVTTPYKEAAFRAVRPVDRETRRIGMVNTIVYDMTESWGEGTDGRGVLGWMDAHGFGGHRLWVLGFGPTARSVIHRAWLAGNPPAAIWTRRPDAAARALRRWRSEPRTPEQVRDPRAMVLRGTQPRCVGWDRPEDDGPADPPALIVSTLPPEADLPQAFFTGLPRGAVFLDMNYGGDRDTHAVRAAFAGLWSADGLGPLLRQAACSLERWLGEPVDPELFREAAGVPANRLGPRRRGPVL